MRKVLIVFLLSGFAFAQGGAHSGSIIKSTSGQAGTVRVCTSAATGTPCAPLATIYSDAALSTPIVGSIVTSDIYGNYSYYAEPGNYKEQIVVGSNTLTLPVTIADPVTATHTYSNTGTFNQTAHHLYVQSIVRGDSICDPAAEWNATQGTRATDALAACIQLPASGTAEGNSIAGYAIGGSSGLPAVGLYGQARCSGSGCRVWGANTMVRDSTGYTNVGLIGMDVNVDPQNADTSYPNGNGAFNAALNAPNSGNFGNAYTAQKFNGGVGNWTASFLSADKATDQALIVGAHTGANPQGSQNIVFNHIDAGGVGHTSTLLSDSSGRLLLNPYAGQLSISQQGNGKAVLDFGSNSTARAYTFPDRDGTIATLSGDQTFTGVNTLSNGVSVGGGSAMLKFDKVSVLSIDLASVNVGACTAEQTTTVTGSALGDMCFVTGAIATEAGGLFKCAITATDTAKWQFCNFSAAPIDRASQNYTIRLLR